MLQPTERREEIIQYLHKIMETRFCESCQLIQRQVEQHGKQIWEELCSTIVKVLQASAGSTASYLAFSFLDSSVYTDRLEFHVDVFDEGFYLDEVEKSGIYCPEFLQTVYRDDIYYFRQCAEEKFARLQNYEVIEIKKQYIVFYYAIIYRLLENLAGLIMEEIKKSGIKMTDGFKITYGGYMDKAVIVRAGEYG